jgi:phospholipid transport system substrate-binding protein
MPPPLGASTQEERSELVAMFTEVLERAYINRVEAFAGENITYIGEAIDASYATVRSKITTDRRSELTLDYRLHLRDGRWRVYDLQIDGVSFVSTYRSQFDRIIQAESYSSLLERMRSIGLQQLPVIAGGSVVAVVSRDSIMRVLQARHMLGHAASR